MVSPKKYIENTYKLVEEFSHLNLSERCIITGGICANSYFPPELRRYSNDIDVLVEEKYTPENFEGPYFHESGEVFYAKRIEKNLYIFLIPSAEIEAENYPKEKIGTFNEYFGESHSEILSRRLKKDEIFKIKTRWMISGFRGAEAVKDAYDISLLAADAGERLIEECVEELGEDSVNFYSWIISMRRFTEDVKRKLQPLIACGVFPEKIYFLSLENLCKLCESYSPEEIIRASAILCLSRREVREILKREKIDSDKTNDLNRVLCEKLKYTDLTKKEKLAKNILDYGKKGLLEALNEIFPKSF